MIFHQYSAVLPVIVLVLSISPVRGGEPRPGEAFRDCPQCPELVVVPAGSFVMGTDSKKRYERPAHRVEIPRPFAIGKYELTFDEWRVCVDAGGCKRLPDDHKWGRGRRPVMNITWEEANGYLNWLGAETGHAYRLPTEAEWEYAARGGAGRHHHRIFLGRRHRLGQRQLPDLRPGDKS